MTDDTPRESDSPSGLGRRTLLQGIGVATGATLLGTDVADATGGAETETDGSTDPDDGSATYALPPLLYGYDALEPHIDERIMRLHHDEHHQGYVDGANAAVEKLAEMRESGDFEGIKHVKRDLSFNLSGHILHSIFWRNMSPEGGGHPSGSLAEALAANFGSVEAMRAEFSATAANVEGSGWGMLVYDHRSDSLLVTQAEVHNDLAVQGATPLLVLDVWEHAYYLQYENDRGDYIDAFWNVVDWDNVAARYEHAKKADVLNED